MSYAQDPRQADLTQEVPARARQPPIPAITVISSRGNGCIKAIRSLRERKERERTGSYFIEGLRLVSEAVQTQAAIETLVVVPERLKSGFGQEIVQIQRQRGTPCLAVTAEVFASLSDKEGRHEISAVVRQRWDSLDTIRPDEGLCWIALGAAQYPGNLGTILRVSDAVGGAGVLLIGHTADPYDPTAVRASTGAVLSQRLARTSVEAFACWKDQRKVTVIGASPAAALDYRDVAYPAPLALLMGSEGRGLSPQEQALCDHMVRIPMVGRSDSLNLAIATSLLLYEVFHQRRGPPHPRLRLSPPWFARFARREGEPL
ncbi:MAG TPA: RNA methyltransferase [Chthonomonadaceae bacterium]|nr:RNA methyltransferase [Chthonomonadaceae bacterium]